MIRCAFVVTFVLLVGSGTALAQDSGTILGEVVDRENGEPLAGAQVHLPGTSIGTVTDETGRFRIPDAPAGDVVLQAQFLGYRTAETRLRVTAGGTIAHRFELAREFLNLDAIVAAGTAGGAREREVAWSVGMIEPDEVTEPIATVDQLLTGRLPGVTVQQSSGMAGSGSQIRLRGNVSVALSNEPLVYVDGVRVRSDGYPKNVPVVGNTSRGPNDTPSPLNDLDPADIERVEIVKGPAATTLYGAEAATGVIQIFTRQGSTGPPVWRASVQQGFDRALEFGPADEPFFGLDPWLDDAAWRQRYSLSVAGGGSLRYYASASLDDNDGLLPNDHEDRRTARVNLEFRPRDDFQVRWSSAHTRHDLVNTSAGQNAEGFTMNVLRGETNNLGDASPEALEGLLEWDIETRLDHTILDLTTSYSPSASFTNRLTLGYDRTASDMRQLRPVGFPFAPDGILAEQEWANTITTLDYVGNLELPRVREIEATLAWGSQSVTSTVESDAGYAEGFEVGEDPTIASGELSLFVDSRTRVRNSGVFAQTTLGLADRYFLTTGLRVDGSTAFGSDFGLEAYPRVGLSYIVSDEPFWPDRWGRLKLRASYGHAGRAPGAFDALRTWNQIDFGGETALLPGALGNPELGTERTAETEIGFEGAFLESRLTADFSVYRRETSDALFPVTQIPSLGFPGTQLENVGTFESHGLELALEGTLIHRREFGWDAGLYVFTHDSEVISLGGAAPLPVDEVGWIMEGEPLLVLRGVRVTNPDEIAEPIVEEDHVYGPNLPTRTLGLSTTFRFPAGLTLHARGEYLGGHYVMDDISSSLARRQHWPVCNAAYETAQAGQRDRLTAWERFWCASTDVPGGGPIYPADFFRLRELTAWMPVPLPLGNGTSATLTFSGRNFWTWINDDFLAFDPEMVGDEGMHTRLRTIVATVPPPATFVVALEVLR